MVKKANLGKKYKLSDIWTWASKDLKQVKGKFGNAANGEACAMGAIEYYRTNKEDVNPDWRAWKKISYQKDINSFRNEYGDIADINDSGEVLIQGKIKHGKPWSFKK